MIEIGDIIRTSRMLESSMPYKVIQIEGGCTCVHYLDWINHQEKPQRPHMHLTCVLANHEGNVRETDQYYLNYYYEQDGRILGLSLDYEGNCTEIFIIGYKKNTQMSLL